MPTVTPAPPAPDASSHIRSGDFSAARNESIKHAKGRWIFWIDADERLAEESFPELKKILSTKPAYPLIYNVKIHNRRNHGKNYYLSTAHRLFNNGHGISFSGKVHEQISPSVRKLKGKEKNSGIIIYHHGYDLSKEEMDKKYSRNLDLILQNLNDEPNNAYYHFTAGKQYALLKNHSLAEEHFQQADKYGRFSKYEKASLLNVWSESLLELDRMNQSSEKIKYSLSLVPHQVGAYYMKYKISESGDDTNTIILNLKHLLKNNQKIRAKGSPLPNDVLIDDDTIKSLLAHHYFMKKSFNESVGIYRDIETFISKDVDSLGKYIDSLLQTGALEEASRILNHVILMSPELKYYSTLGMVFMKLQHFEKAIAVYEIISDKFPEATRELKYLAGLYAKTGDIKKAEDILKKLS